MSELEPSEDREFERQLRLEGERWRAQRVGCPNPDLLLVRSSDLLESAARERLVQHVAQCPHCARLVRDLDHIDPDETEPLVQERVLSRIRVEPRAGRARWVAIAAGISIGLVVGAQWWARSVRRPETTTVARTSERAAEPASPAPVVALWSIEPPDVRLPLSSLAPSRGQEGSDTTGPFVDALAAYRRGDYDAAIAGLEQVNTTDPGNVGALLYLGVSYLMTGRAADALAPLERAWERAASDRKPEIAWYLATAEQRTGGLAASRARLAALCARPSSYQSRACAAGAALK